MTGVFDLAKTSETLNHISRVFSHKELRRTQDKDRFCPYILLRGLTEENTISLKTRLLKDGIKLTDGYPFRGSEFYPDQLVLDPTKENGIKLKFIPSDAQLTPLISKITGSPVVIFDFYIASPLNSTCLPKDVSYHPIKIEDCSFIKKVIPK